MGVLKTTNSAAGTVAFGAVSGGVGSSLSGGNFWEGALIGGIVAGLNHAMHLEDGPGDGDDGKKKGNGEDRF